MQGLQYRSAGSGIVGGGGGSPCINRPPKLEMGSNPVKGGEESPVDKIQRLTMENAVVVFSMTACCMGHVVKRLFCSLGVNPAVCELDEDGQGAEMEKILLRLVGQKPSLPAVFIGGKLVGGLDRLMAMHISGDLVGSMALICCPPAFFSPTFGPILEFAQAFECNFSQSVRQQCAFRPDRHISS